MEAGEFVAEQLTEPGFILDESSGLYYHASTGFYHDPTAGWYYNTNDGQYYKFEEGRYVPLASLSLESKFDSSEVPDTENCTPYNDLDERAGDVSCVEEITEDNSVQHAPESESVAAVSQGVSDSYPAWHYDHGRGMYWYFDKESVAYYLYTQHDDSTTSDTIGAVRPEEQEGEWNAADESQADDEPQPASKWIEETLIEMYLQGYTKILDTSDDYEGTDLAGMVDCRSSQDPHVKSDDDLSEGLEEGEWVPDEEDWVPGEGDWDNNASKWEESESVWEKNDHRYAEDDWPCRERGRERERESEGEGEGELEEGESEGEEGERRVLEDAETHVASKIEGVGTNTSVGHDEEHWQAQFGQVALASRKDIQVPGIVDLWDWMTVTEEGKGTKAKFSMRLLGRIAPSRSKLHPSLSSSGGLIKTSRVCGAEYDLVKVSSGKLYRLRRPSSKHLTSIAAFDSSNPTLSWGFPNLGLSEEPANETECYTEQLNACQSDMAMERQTLQVVSKPFVPNLGHWRFQDAATFKRARRPVAGNLRIFSDIEISKIEERKQRYRDRAAERRILHNGIGTGPGQKALPVHELEKLEAELATDMIGALETAAAAPRLGEDNKGKRMLMGMGWKEGQSLGVSNEGLKDPVQVSGNSGRAGLGWT